MTADEFLAVMAKRLATTPEWLKEQGYRVEPCKCNWGECPGWQLIRRKTA